MAMVFGIVALLALLAFIVWDRRRIANPSPVVDVITSHVGKLNLRANGSAAVSLMAGVMALSELLNPRLPPFTGRMSFVYETAYATSPYGISIFWFLLAAAFATAMVFARRK
jgi:hypothetical protein